MKRNFFVGLIVLALILVATATGASSDQGRRLAGPFCVGKANLTPYFVKGTGWVSRAGVVRSISVTEVCQATENRELGRRSRTTTPQPPTPPQPRAPQERTAPTVPRATRATRGTLGQRVRLGSPSRATRVTPGLRVRMVRTAWVMAP